ncbi:putative ribonuclease H-like domain-containing protein [Tanacetum coccineum]|uniref:Ribonuclease H-like domain-containing protein n=1 Tax=Tanacetum coccineum TaxID=301880 RepID=A0ABQ4YR31_9ASTR
MSKESYRWMFDIKIILLDSMNYIPVSLENQANPHAGASEVTNSAGTSQTPIFNASEEKDEDVELIVVPSTVKNTEEKVKSRTSSTNSKKEEILTEPPQEKKVSSTDTSEDNPKIIAFRRELEEIALKHLGTISENNSTARNLTNPETGIFDEASSDEEEEPKKIAEALQDDSWVQAMQEELLQFKLQQVWVLVDLPHGMKEKVLTKMSFSSPVAIIEAIRFYVSQPLLLALFAPDHPKKIYKVVKALDKKIIIADSMYVDDIIFGSTKKSWCDEFEALMKSRFQMSSIGELTFFLGLQVKQNKAGIFISQDKYVVEILKKFDLINVTPKTSYLMLEKRIFKYLKSKPNLGLWYPRESPFDLEAFSDSDYGGSNLDRKSIIGGCQFLGQRLISWQCKKQTIVATFTTEAEYVAARKCAVTMKHNQSGGSLRNPDDRAGLKIVYFLRGFQPRVYNFSKLIFDAWWQLKSKTKFLMYPRFLQLILDIQTENKHPYLAVTLTKKIFRNMKRGFRGAPRPLLPTMLLVATTNPNAGQEHPDVAQSQPSSSTIPIPSTSLPPEQSPPPIPIPIPASTPTRIPETDPEPMEHTFEEPSPAHQHFSPPQEHAQGQMTLDDLLQVVPQLLTRVDSLEKDLKQTKLTMGSAIVKLVKKVKKLEDILKRRNMVLSASEEEESKAQGRKSQDDPLVSLVQGLVTPSKTTVNTSGEEQVEDISPTTLEAAKTLSRVASQKPKSIDKGRRYKRRKETKGKKVVTSLDFQEEVSTGAEGVNTGLKEFNTCSIKVSTVSQKEGKALMIIEEAPKKTKEQILQEEASLAEAIRLDTLEKEEEAKQIEAIHEFVQGMLGSDLQGEDFAKKMVDLVNQRKKHFAEERARAKRNKPMTQSQLRTYMMNYLKNQGTWKLSQLKNLSFEEVKEEFDKLVKQVESFAPINFEATKDSLKRFGKQIARKGLHSDKADEDESEDSKDDDPISGTNIPINPVPVAIKPPSIATYKIIKQGEKGVYQM